MSSELIQHNPDREIKSNPLLEFAKKIPKAFKDFLVGLDPEKAKPATVGGMIIGAYMFSSGGPPGVLTGMLIGGLIGRAANRL